MKTSLLKAGAILILAAAASPATWAASASGTLPLELMNSSKPTAEPVNNAAFIPGPDAAAAPAFMGALKIAQTQMLAKPAVEHPLQNGRDARLFPGVTLEFFTMDGMLVPVERGEMVQETAPGKVPSYWRVIPQFGRVWKEKADGEWSRAAFPIMLVNDTENAAYQGLASFLYSGQKLTRLRFQFIQQTAPYLLHQHFITWGSAPVVFTASVPADLDAKRAEAKAELAARMPAKPWSELVKSVPSGTLAGFGGPLDPKWMVVAALVKDGVLYYQNAPTPYGDYPYPLEMRFGVRSATKTCCGTTALMRLAQIYGPWVLTLKVGDYVPGLDPKWKRIRFVDASNMATGFGGVGTFKTNPNDLDDGYLDGNYDTWYSAPSHAEKIHQIVANLRPYPWEPGTVMRYRDQDYYLYGVAMDAFLKSMRGPKADLWEMLKAEVFRPIGIYHAPAVHTLEPPDGHAGFVWCNAGYYPTLDDLAKLGTLYRDLGAHNGQQLLNRTLIENLLSAKDAMRTKTDMSVDRSPPPDTSTGATAAQTSTYTVAPTYGAVPAAEQLYKTGFWFIPYIGSRTHKQFYLPEMIGSGDNRVILFPNGLIAIRAAKAGELPEGTKIDSTEEDTTAQAVDRLSPF